MMNTRIVVTLVGFLMVAGSALSEPVDGKKESSDPPDSQVTGEIFAQRTAVGEGQALTKTAVGNRGRTVTRSGGSTEGRPSDRLDFSPAMVRAFQPRWDIREAIRGLDTEPAQEL